MLGSITTGMSVVNRAGTNILTYNYSLWFPHPRSPN